ncbi:integrase/recombinase XerD [Paenibacillus sp. LBL]|uniref:tyrosine-type recombinase/integrase n=1 Tax=Paenibacillus sp. LBL TaxID=2940563 RepID=UPI0024769315|nr:tyrosine-type recombinase/integrase [Paenibacillus sp. LBL]MDH6675614.1 integrase/recombinase XerD [Paenibacillus sp. LBL]
MRLSESIIINQHVHNPFSSNIRNLHVQLLDKQMYREIISYISSQEDIKGNYDYSSLSNIGMIYLFVHHPASNRRDNTKKDYIRELLSLIEYISVLKKSDLRELTRFDMEQYQYLLEKKYPTTTTRAKKIGILRSFLEWCYSEDYLVKNLSRGLIPVRINREDIPEREFDEGVVQKAIMHFNDHPKIKSLLLILATTGLRLNEIIVPEWGALSFDTKRNKYYLRTITKRGKIRYATIKDYALEELCEYRKRLGLSTIINSKDTSPFYPNRYSKHYSLSGLSTFLSKHMEEAGLVTIQNQRATPHFMRHYFAQAAFSGGAPIGFIAETLGHAIEKTTKENYLRNSIKKEHDVSEYVDIHLP